MAAKPAAPNTASGLENRSINGKYPEKQSSTISKGDRLDPFALGGIVMAAKAPANPTVQSLAAAFLSKEQVAEILHVSVATLLRWHNMGEGPPRIKVGRKIYYVAGQVEDFMRLQGDSEQRSRRRKV